MIEILLLLDVENVTVTIQETKRYACHCIIEFFEKKCHEDVKQFVTKGIELMKILLGPGNEIKGTSREFEKIYMVEVCQLLNRSESALAKLDVNKNLGSLKEVLFLVVGKYENSGFFDKFIGNQSVDYQPSDGCKLLTKTALYSLEKTSKPENANSKLKKTSKHSNSSKLSGKSSDLLELWCHVFFNLETTSINGNNASTPTQILQNPNIVFSLDKLLNYCLKTGFTTFSNCILHCLQPLFNNLRSRLQLAKKSQIQSQPTNAISNYFSKVTQAFENKDQPRSTSSIINSEVFTPAISFLKDFQFFEAAPYLTYALLIIDCEYYTSSKFENVWPMVLKIFSKNPLISASEALESAVHSLNYRVVFLKCLMLGWIKAI